MYDKDVLLDELFGSWTPRPLPDSDKYKATGVHFTKNSFDDDDDDGPKVTSHYRSTHLGEYGGVDNGYSLKLDDSGDRAFATPSTAPEKSQSQNDPDVEDSTAFIPSRDAPDDEMPSPKDDEMSPEDTPTGASNSGHSYSHDDNYDGPSYDYHQEFYEFSDQHNGDGDDWDGDGAGWSYHESLSW